MRKLAFILGFCTITFSLNAQNLILNGNMASTSLNYVNNTTQQKTPSPGSGWGAFFGSATTAGGQGPNQKLDIVSMKDVNLSSGQGDVIKLTATGVNGNISDNARLVQRISPAIPVGFYRLKFKAKATTSTKTVLVPSVRVHYNSTPANVLKDYNGTGIPTHSPITLTESWKEYYVDYDLSRNASAMNSSATVTSVNATSSPAICFSLQNTESEATAGVGLMIDDVSFTVIENSGYVDLSAGKTNISFSKGPNFNILSMYSGNNSSWTEETGYTGNIWSLKIRDQSKQSTTYTPTSTQSTYKGLTTNGIGGVKPTVILNWDITTASNVVIPVRVLVSANNTTQLIDWEIEADLPDGWMVENLTFPNLIFNENAADKVIMPEGFGVEYGLLPGSSYFSGYPRGRGTVQLMCLLKGQNVFYFATHDKNANLKAFRTSVAVNGLISVRNEIETSEGWTNSDGSFKLPWATSVGLGDLGWEQAVIDWYKPFTYTTPWGAKTLAEKKVPQWLLDVDIWFVPAHSRTTVLDWTMQAIDFFGAKRTASHSYYWNTKTQDTKFPEVLPARPEYKDFVKAVQAKGSHVIPYMNGRLWDTTTVSYQEEQGSRYLARRKNNTPYMEVYSAGAPLAVVCPNNKIWRDIITDVAKRIQNELGTNGVYVDQLGAAPVLPCWNPNHGHPLGGGDYWVKAVRDMISSIRQQTKSGNILATESNAECYIDGMDLMLMAGKPAGSIGTPTTSYRQVPLFPAIYSDRIILYGFDMYNSLMDLSVRYKNALALLWGSQLGWYKPEFFLNPGVKEVEKNFILKLVNFRTEQHDLLVGGKLIREIIPTGDNPSREIPERGGLAKVVRGAQWIGTNGQSAILLINIDDVAHHVILPDGTNVTIQARDCMRIAVNVLPIKLNKFNGKINIKESTVSLEWMIASKLQKIDIEKSIDGKSFFNIGTVNAVAGKSQFYTDSEFDTGAAYYRLKLTDINGTSEYSSVIYLSKKMISLMVYPNPAEEDVITVTFSPIQELGVIKIVSLSGKVIYQKNIPVAEKQMIMDIATVPSGSYVLAVNNSQFLKFIRN